MMKFLSSAAGLAILALVVIALLATPIGTFAAIAFGIWVSVKVHNRLTSKGYDNTATIFVVFFTVPIVVSSVMAVGWTVGCLTGTNGCRSPF